MFRKLITCGGVDTNDSAMVIIKRGHKRSCSYAPIHNSYENSCNDLGEICRGDELGGSQRSSCTCGNQHQLQPYTRSRKGSEGVKSSNKKKSQFNKNQKQVSAAYKPVNGPNCSQCGKMFKPQKMHAHMKSCRGMKHSARGSDLADNSKPRRSMDSCRQELLSGY
ncbi:protein SOSEKI 1-like [Actinidia eriantha]|uniref:protein SOSEKI 1-like n=1 Tax=Actinidia eriantha TaxID=165200 RepID=UPI00259040FC|nr:protein SOSEKI 1-like [Actinidia eriantha]